MNFKLEIDNKDDYKTAEHVLDTVFNQSTSRLFNFITKKGNVIFVLDRYEPELNIECSIIGFGKWATREIMKSITTFLFVTLKCKRVTCLVSEDNKKSLKFVKRMGMKKEGVLDRASKTGKKLIIWGYFPEDCKFYG